MTLTLPVEARAYASLTTPAGATQTLFMAGPVNRRRWWLEQVDRSPQGPVVRLTRWGEMTTAQALRRWRGRG